MIADDVAMAARIGGLSELTTAQIFIAYHRSRTPSPEEVEAVARAIYTDSYTNYGTCSEEHWSKTSHVQRDFCRGQARAALAASDEWRAKELERKELT